ncbi:hypothetical protein JFL43_01710 [Viridibacillus sp. YIM B01967]|uniref:Uncharacterized protein n=1 Tax=Viridibacillus soli TaxID=2798301 RepID=A0ABS1H2I0_9BACL|nr:hypothetical protein [Viridibacillus soli]MBK3493605.1 hypothetical protein [Viridibacillus soli]
MKRFIKPLGILLCLLFGGVWFIQQFQNQVEATTNESWTPKGLGDKLEKTGSDRTPGDIWAKLAEKNISFVNGVLINYPKKRINVMIEGRQQYIDENEKDIKKIARGVIRKTKYKDYSIHVNKSFTTTLETTEQYNELNIEEIKRSLKAKGYDEVQRVLKETEVDFVNINILTSLSNNDLTSINRGKEIEKEIRKGLAKEIETLKTNNVLIEIHVYNIKNEKVI